jgi:ABC-2 type transport system permease protein
MRKAGLVARREFMAAVSNKGFVVGLLLMPAVFAVIIVLMPRLMRASGTRVAGEVAFVDPTGRLTAELKKSLSVEAIQARRDTALARAVAGAVGASTSGDLRAGPAPLRATGELPALTVVEPPASPGTTDLQTQKAWLTAPAPSARHLALVVAHPDAVSLRDGQTEYGTYDLYVPSASDERIESEIREALREALVTARTAARNLDLAQIQAMTRVAAPRSVTVAAGGERQTATGFNRIVPFVFAGLLVFGVMIGAQTLLTSTVEEKSSRVIEVLLSAVSPLELMAGKIVGQMAVSMLVLAVYVGIGLLGLTSFAMLGLLDPWLILYLVIFFVITYLVFASVFGAIGAAVNEMREAQSLVMPVTLVLMLPWFFAAPLAREPNSTFAIAMSFVPPINSFAMMVRMASASPPPIWQVWLTIAIGLASACAVTWVASKVFRMGLLMHGKPPDFATLVRWARQA